MIKRMIDRWLQRQQILNEITFLNGACFCLLAGLIATVVVFSIQHNGLTSEVEKLQETNQKTLILIEQTMKEVNTWECP